MSAPVIANPQGEAIQLKIKATTSGLPRAACLQRKTVWIAAGCALAKTHVRPPVIANPQGEAIQLKIKATTSGLPRPDGLAKTSLR